LSNAFAHVGGAASVNARSKPTRMRALAGMLVGPNPVLAGDNRTRYDGVTIALHWLTAVLVLEQFLTAQVWGLFDRPLRQTLLTTHTSFGIIIGALIVARIAWRLMPRHQLTVERADWIEAASKTLQYVLYGLLAGEVVLGFAARWTNNKPLSLFGALIPAPLGPFSKGTQHIIANAHGSRGALSSSWRYTPRQRSSTTTCCATTYSKVCCPSRAAQPRLGR